MDPLSLFYDIHELIIQHFDCQEIFKLWKVSTLWQSLVLEKNNYAMQKIKLNVEDSNHDEVLMVLQNKESTVNTDLFELLKTNRKYRNVKINIDHGWDYMEELIRNLRASLISIEVSDVYVDDLEFPNLTKLKLDNVLLDGLTTSCDKLTKLSATQSGKELWLKKESPIAIKRALKRNQGLKALELDEALTEVIFRDDISRDINFQLQHLQIKCQKSFDYFSNIRSFLLMHTASLIHLEIGSIDDTTIEWIYINMKCLKSLQFKIHFENNPRGFHLISHDSVIALDLDLTSYWQWTMNIKFALREIILKTPCLEILILRMPSPLDLDDFRFILVNAPKLRKFQQNNDCLNSYREVHEQMVANENVSEKVEISNIFL